MLGGTGRASTVGWTRALLFTARLATFFTLPLAISAGWLLWRSLDWPLVGDATIFHFIAGQFQMGAIQYRDIFDINMPLIYFVHAAVIAIGGTVTPGRPGGPFVVRLQRVENGLR
jgi:hypothetical protein